MKIGLFGGSFDPPTKAHLAVAEHLIENKIVDQVQFVPAYISYHGKDYVASPEMRVLMLCNMIDESKYSDQIEVCSYEISEEMQSSTYDFCQAYLNEPYNKKHDFYFICGMDNGVKIPKFGNGQKLMNLLPFIVVGRAGFDSSNCKLKHRHWFLKKPHQSVHIKRDDLNGVSSTFIRDTLANITYSGLPRTFFNACSWNVFKTIIRHDLYVHEQE